MCLEVRASCQENHLTPVAFGPHARHDQKADAVADSIFVDLLTQPHEENAAAGHDQDRGQASHERQVSVRIFKLFGDHVLAVLIAAHDEQQIASTLY